LEIVRELLGRGANVNAARTDVGMTSLMWACGNGHLEIVRELLGRGANVNAAQTDDGMTPLMLACCMGHLDTARYTAMLDRFPVYVCTSWQEGGPLPVMDALSRGALPVMTPVGQIPEFLTHGETVFFCNTESEFIESLDSLAKNPGLLSSMRIKAHSAYLRARDPETIRDRVSSVFLELLG
jgi:ankyrin repeat protein